MILPNYDTSKIQIQLYNSVLGWQTITTEFSSIQITRSVSVDTGALFRPESASMTLTTKDINRWSSGNIVGQNTNGKIRVRYIGQPQTDPSTGTYYTNAEVFNGVVRDVTISAQPGKPGEPIDYVATIHATDNTEDLNNTVIQNFTANSLPVTDRIDKLNAASSTAADILDYGLSTQVAAMSADSTNILTPAQEVADANYARFYTNCHNQVIMDARALTGEPTVHFTDDNNDTGYRYRSLVLTERVENSIRKIVANTKSNNDIVASRQVSGNITSDREFTVDVLPTTDAIGSWVSNFPLQGYTVLSPTSMDVEFVPALLEVELLTRITVTMNQRQYKAGIQTINHSITPYRWNLSYGLIPSYALEHVVITSPSAAPTVTYEIQDFVNTNRSPNTWSKRVYLSWTPPSPIGSTTGYRVMEIRSTLSYTGFPPAPPQPTWDSHVDDSGPYYYTTKDIRTSALSKTYDFNCYVYPNYDPNWPGGKNTYYSVGYGVWATTDDPTKYSPLAWVTLQVYVPYVAA